MNTKTEISERELERRDQQRAGVRLLSYRDLVEKKGIRFARQWIRKMIEARKFPRPITIGTGDRRVAFVESEIDSWIADRIRHRDEGDSAAA